MEFRKKFISLDLETTHLDVENGRIIEVGAQEVEFFFDPNKNEIAVEFGKSYESLVDPEIPVPAAVLALTGITAAELKDAPEWKDVKPVLRDFLGETPFLGHNLAFDLGFLRAQGLKLKNPVADTLEMAQTLLPLAASHSLEFLAEARGVKVKESHRALADCQSAARVCGAILNDFLAYSGELRAEIRGLLENSEISFRDLILELPTPSLTLPTRGREEEKPPRPEQGGIAGELQALENEKKPMIAVVPHPVFLDFVAKEHQLVPPDRALCTIRLAALKQKDKLSSLERKILIKTAIYRALYHFFDLRSVRWAWEERDFLHLITTEGGLCTRHGCEYARAVAALQPRIYFTTIGGLAALARDWETSFDRPVIFFGLGELEDGFAESARETWNLRLVRQGLGLVFPLGRSSPREVAALESEADLFFGILHLVYLKREGEYAENIIADARGAHDERYAKLFHPAEKFIMKLEKFCVYLERLADVESGERKNEIESLSRKLVSLQNFLKKFFTAQDEKEIYWLRFNADAVDLNAAPRDLSEKFGQFRKKFASVTVADYELPKISMAYFQKRLGLQDLAIQRVAARNEGGPVSLSIAAHSATTAENLKLLLRLPGTTIAVLPNESALRELYEGAVTAGNAAGRLVLAHKHSGSAERIRAQLEEARRDDAGGPVLLLLTAHALGTAWKIFPPAENFVIFRLPFEAPGARPPLGGQNFFRAEALPRAIQMLNSFFTRFLTADGRHKQIYLLDSRARTDYDGEFVRAIEDLSDFELV